MDYVSYITGIRQAAAKLLELGYATEDYTKRITLFEASVELTKQAEEVQKSLGILWDNY